MTEGRLTRKGLSTKFALPRCSSHFLTVCNKFRTVGTFKTKVAGSSGENMEKPATASRTKRRAVIYERLRGLMVRAPANAPAWNHLETLTFTGDCLELRKHAERGNFERFLIAADKVARTYGTTLAAIDPGEGA